MKRSINCRGTGLTDVEDLESTKFINDLKHYPEQLVCFKMSKEA